MSFSRRGFLRSASASLGATLLDRNTVELFVAKYLQVEPIKRRAKPGDRLTFTAKLPKEGYYLESVEVFYEPLPKPPEMSWLRQPRSYSLPDESRVLRPKAPPPYYYADRTTGVVEMSLDGRYYPDQALQKRARDLHDRLLAHPQQRLTKTVSGH